MAVDMLRRARPPERSLDVSRSGRSSVAFVHGTPAIGKHSRRVASVSRNGCAVALRRFCLVRQRRRPCPVSHCFDNDARCLGGGVPQRGIVEMGVDGGGTRLAVPQQPSHRVVSPAPFMTPCEAQVRRQSWMRTSSRPASTRNLFQRRPRSIIGPSRCASAAYPVPLEPGDLRGSRAGEWQRWIAA